MTIRSVESIACGAAANLERNRLEGRHGRNEAGAMADRGTGPVERRTLSALDILVLLQVLIPVGFCVALSIVGKPAIPWLYAHRLWLDILALIEGAILLVWLFVDGIRSPLRRWLPPFYTVPGRHVLWVRWVVILVMLTSTIICVVCYLLSR